MDSLTQMSLGAAVAEAAIGRRIGRRALIVGAALGTLPDLDVLLQYADAVDSFTRHRGFSHSLFVLSLLSLPLSVLLQRLLDRNQRASAALWWFATWAILITHALLDGFTSYGTQLFWPLPMPPVAIGSIFIIDPLYTVPILVGLILALRWRDARGRRANALGLLLAHTWLLSTLLLQQIARADALAAMKAQALQPQSMQVLPHPFGVIWRVIAIDGDDVLNGWTSLIDGRYQIRFDRIPRDLDRLGELAIYPPIERLLWFSQDFVTARVIDDTVVLTDVRIGTPANPIFSFDVAKQSGHVFKPILTQLRSPDISLEDVAWLPNWLLNSEVAPPVADVKGQRITLTP